MRQRANDHAGCMYKDPKIYNDITTKLTLYNCYLKLRKQFVKVIVGNLASINMCHALWLLDTL